MYQDLVKFRKSVSWMLWWHLPSRLLFEIMTDHLGTQQTLTNNSSGSQSLGSSKKGLSNSFQNLNYYLWQFLLLYWP